MIRAIVFDCFGVILTDALSAIVQALESDQPAIAQEIRAIVHAANKGIIEPEVSSGRAAELLGMTLDEYRTTIRNAEVRNQELLAYIKVLRKDYKTAMLSNIGKGGMERRFPGNELADYFDEVVISGEIGYAKPDAEAYVITADRLGVESAECVFVDDRPDYVYAAQQVGMQAFVYEDFAGFRAELTRVLTASR